MVDWLASTRSTIFSSTWGQIEAGGYSPEAGSESEAPGSTLQIGHGLHRHGHRKVPVLPRRGGHDLYPRGAGKELGHEFVGLHGGRQSDPRAGLGSSASSRSSETARCAPRLVPATAWTSSTMMVSTSVSVSRALEVNIRKRDSGRGDEDVRRVAEQRAAVRRRGVPGPVAHGDERGGQVQPLGGLRDADQRRTQVRSTSTPRPSAGNVQHPGLTLGRLRLGGLLPPGRRVRFGSPQVSGGRGTAAGPGPTGKRRAFCRNRWVPPPGHANRRRWRSRRRPGRGWAPKRRPGTSPGWAG